MTGLLLAPQTQTYLLAVARRALARALRTDAPVPPRPDDEALDQPTRVFVSWHRDGHLVGCIGTLDARQPLEEAVDYFAIQAGLHDPRTPAASADDLPELHCEISVLTEPEPMRETGVPAIARAIEPGVDGVILQWGSRRSVFLPVVWKSLPDPMSFLGALCKKGGIDPEADDPPIVAARFRAERFEEPLDGLP